MSAFVVEDRTINRIIAWLNLPANNWYKSRIAKAIEAQADDPEFAYRLGVSMHLLNIEAVNSRYEEANPPDFGYCFVPMLCDEFQSLKSLRCWLYQCAEGDIPGGSALWQTMSKVAGEIALEIVQRLPQYERAEW